MEKLEVKIKVFPEDRYVLRKKKKKYEEQTIVAETSNGILYYYKHIFNKVYGIEIDSTSFKAHVTINNGRDAPINLFNFKINNYLKSIDGKSITVKYNPKPYLYWHFIALEVYSKELDEIRNKLELPPNFKFHITIGKIKDNFISNKKYLIHNNKLNTCFNLRSKK